MWSRCARPWSRQARSTCRHGRCAPLDCGAGHAAATSAHGTAGRRGGAGQGAGWPPTPSEARIRRCVGGGAGLGPSATRGGARRGARRRGTHREIQGVYVRTVRNLTAILFTAVTIPVAAQQPPPAGRWAEAKCDLKPGHFLVNQGYGFLKSATTTKLEDQRKKDLADAQRVLTQAVTGDQDKNPAAWYYLARYYIMTDDPPGVDSAFRRAEALKPQCAADIGLWRRYLWVPTFNAGVAAWQANNTDSAIASFRRANAMLPNEPTGFKYIATLFFNTGQTDSALSYFRKAADIAATNPKFAQDRKDVLFNLGRIQQSVQKLADAEATYREYLALYPNDSEVLAALGSVAMQRGNKDSAFAIYKQIIARGDSMGYYALYRAGAEIAQSVPDEPDTAAAGSSCRSTARASRPALTAARIRARCDSVTTGAAKAYISSSREAFSLAAQAL